MSLSNDKKDLSDLKARLGLKKPAKTKKESKKADGGAAKATRSGSRAAVPRPDKPSRDTDGSASVSDDGFFEAAEVIEPAQPSAPAPRKPGPPPGAKGPPPTARAAASPTPREPATSSFGEADEEIDLKELGLDDDAGLGLSLPIIILLVVLLGVGLFFGYMASQSLQTRSIETARINDANSMLQYLEPRFEALAKAEAIIDSLDPMNPDFDAVERLGELDFVVAGDVLPGNRLLLSSTVITPLNRFMAETNLLHNQIEEHVRLTSTVDRDEIEGLIADKEEYLEEEILGVVFHYSHIGGYFENRDAYTPPEGRLAFVKDLEQDEDGMVEIRMMGRENSNRVEGAALILLEKGDLLRTEGENAVTRHERRVRDLQQRTDGISRRMERLKVAVEGVALRDTPPIFSFSSAPREYNDEGDLVEVPPEAPGDSE